MPLINYRTKVHFADGILEAALRAELDALEVSRPLLVANVDVAGDEDFERLESAIPAKIAYVLFDRIAGNSTESVCRDGATLYLEEECDCIIGFGGGAVLDAAKAIGLAATHYGPLNKYAAIEGGVVRVKDRLPPTIAIPTSAGAGSEANPAAHIIADGDHIIGLMSPYLAPRIAICDPTLTLGLSPDETAGTGMDALTHCVETYIANAYDPTSDGIALDGLGRVANNIERAVQNGDDLNARREMMAGALHGALALPKGLGATHAMSHALARQADADHDHGVLNAILLPHVLEFNAPAASDRFAALRGAMRLPSDASIPHEIQRLSQRIGIPSGLGSIGIDRASLEAAAPLAEKDHNNGTNPRRARAVDYLEMMQAAM